MIRFPILVAMAALFVLTSCRSAYEKQGDKHLTSGDPFKALQRYAYVVKKGNGSREFPVKLTRAYIMAMKASVNQSAEWAKLLSYRERINETMPKVGDAALHNEYAAVVVMAVPALLARETPEDEELAFGLMKDIEGYPDLGQDLQTTLAGITNAYIKKNLAEASEHLQQCRAGNPTEGIYADYILSRTALSVQPNQEMKDLWSEIRKANLKTFLMYDMQDLLPTPPLPAVNRFGVLLAITRMSVTGGSASFDIQAFNGSTSPVQYTASAFTLVDTEGKEYPARGGFSKLLERGDLSPSGSVSFSFPAGIVPSHLRFQSEAGESIKYLP